MGSLTAKGILDPFWETGTEGVMWSVQDCRLPGYDSLFCLDEGDELTVFGNDGKPVWNGIIEEDSKACWTPYPGNPVSSDGQPLGQPVVDGMYVHWVQKNTDPKVWSDMFHNRLRAVLIQKNPRSKVVHPFLLSPDEMLKTFMTMPEKEQHELFRSALYGWLSWYSEGLGRSVGEYIGITIPEVLAMLGNPDEPTIAAWKHYPKRADDMPLPYSPELLLRLALLWRAYGAVMMKFGTDEHRAEYLRKHDEKLGLSPVECMMNGNSDTWRLIEKTEAEFSLNPDTRR